MKNRQTGTLILRLAGPLQAWGSSSRFSSRMTEREPTKSGVMGLMAAALGRRREEDVEDLTSFKFGVRIDQGGTVISDFHTAHTFDGRQSFVSKRYYLADAIFLVGLEGEYELLEEIHQAVLQPVFPIFLGRRSCPPSGAVSLGIRKDIALKEALQIEPWAASEWYRKKQGTQVRLEVVIDAKPNQKGSFERNDMPVSFSQIHRTYNRRSVVSVPYGVLVENPDGKMEHDAMGVF